MRRVSQRVAFATLVLMVAIAGAAVAAGTITGASIKDNSLTGKDIKNHSLSRVDFKGSVRGPAGPAGPVGPAGPSALSKLTTVSGGGPVQPMTAAGGTITCPPGMRVVSGGYSSDGGIVFISRPSDDNQGWSVALANPGDTPVNLTGYASCAGAGQAVAAKAPARWLTPTGRFARQIAAFTR